MKAITFQGFGLPLAIQDLPDPDIDRDELLIKVKFCGICGSDLHCTCQESLKLPIGLILGHEFCGEVIEAGNAFKKIWNKDDLVTVFPAQSCGNCYHCFNGANFLCKQMQIIGLSEVDGAYAEFIKVKASNVIKLPEGFDPTIGALIEPYSVALHAIKLSRFTDQDDILILGGGPIGYAIAEILMAKVNKIIVSEKVNFRRNLIAKLEGVETIDGTHVAEKFLDLAGSRPKIIFETIGIPGTLEMCIDLADVSSQIIIVGACMQKESISSLNATMKELTIKFSLASNVNDFEIIIDLFHRQQIKGSPLISHIITLDEVPNTFEKLRMPKEEAKVLIKVNK